MNLGLWHFGWAANPGARSSQHRESLIVCMFPGDPPQLMDEHDVYQSIMAGIIQGISSYRLRTVSYFIQYVSADANVSH